MEVCKLANFFVVGHLYQLCPQEHILSICSCNLTVQGEERMFFVVGTALVKPEEKEATVGRLLVFQVVGGKKLFLCLIGDSAN